MKHVASRVSKPTIRFSAAMAQPKTAVKSKSSTLLPLPKSASAKLPSGTATMVEGVINYLPFRAALEPNGDGSKLLKVSSALRDSVGASALDKVAVEITRTGDEPETRVPADLRTALAAEPTAKAMWAQITPNARREWVLFVTTAKLPETRRRRIQRACDTLASGKRRVCCFGGYNWLTKDYPKTVESWPELPKPLN